MKPVNKLTDEQLVKLTRQKDQELYRQLVKRYQDKLLRYAIGLIQDEDKAADIVQQAFIKAFVNLKGFKLKKKFSSWIYRIVHNEAINFIKKQSKEVSLEANGWLKEALKSKTNIEQEFDQKQTRKQLSACLKQLPLKYRSPLILFYLEEKSYQEVSEVLRIPTGTVGTRINRGKKLIRIIYNKNNPPGGING